MNGADDRLLVIAGPCAIQDEETALEYAGRLQKIADELSEDLFMVMRGYVEKPRTALGWPGLAFAPNLFDPPDPREGFRLARSILADITGMGVPIAVEWVSAVGPAYLADLVSWGCIGARTVEAPSHRQMASALAMPVGMKNRTDGAVDVAVNAVQVAAHGHAVVDVDMDGSFRLTRTTGNPDCHVVLRGGATGPNYHPAAIQDALRLLDAAGLPQRLVIDASHGNSGKDHQRQRVVAREIGDRVGDGDTAIRGVMLESFLLEGRQDVVAGQPLARGRSVTDACMSWPTTVEVLTELAGASAQRRKSIRRSATNVPLPRMASATTRATPADKAVALVQAGLFDTYMVYERDGVWTVAGGSQAVVTMDAEYVRVRHGDTDHRRPWRSRPLACLGEALAELPIPGWTAYGWLAFELTHLIAGRPDLAGSGDLAHLVVPRAEVRIDRTGAAISCADPLLAGHIDDVLAAVTPEPVLWSATTDVDLNGEWYQQAVADAVREIHRGAFERVVLSRSVPVDAEIDLARSYLAGRAANNPARSFLMDMGGHRAAGFCPETVLEVGADGAVSTQPLAGTRSAGHGTDTDQELRAELLTDPKEIYEHIVSVKLAYDELARVCAPHTVTVSDLLSVKQRGGVQHLGSRVRGQLDTHRSVWDALEAVFPAVTASGVPKAEACEYITRAEREPRGLYSGAVLTVAQDGSLDAGLVLRTLFEENGRRWLRAGAGITRDSRPEREYEETREKLRSVAPYLVEKSASGPVVGSGTDTR